MSSDIAVYGNEKIIGGDKPVSKADHSLSPRKHQTYLKGHQTFEHRVISGVTRSPIAPRPLVVCGPSGSGKTTLLKKLMDEFRDTLDFCVSHTTRKPRKGELNGREYHFVERNEMQTSIDAGDFIEFTQFSGNFYGTSKRAVKEVQDRGRICILDVEIEGVKSLKNTDLTPRFVFIKPPNLEVLETRLRRRGTESEDGIAQRLSRAKFEVEYGNGDGNFDLVVINDDIETAFQTLRSFLVQDIYALRKPRGM